MNGLEQGLADYLLNLPKHCEEKNLAEFPSTGGKVELDLFSNDRREKFILTISQKNVVLYYTFQTRARNCYVLARLDYGAPHLNPDGTRIGSSHRHIYREEYGDRYAIELPKEIFSKKENPTQTFQDFLSFCKVVGTLPFEYGFVFNTEQ